MRLIHILTAAAMSMGSLAMTVHAQSPDNDAFVQGIMAAKPDKASAKQAKELAREGWKTRSVDRPMADQLMQTSIYEGAALSDEMLGNTSRFLVVNTRQTAKNIDMAVTLAKNKALAELASMISAEIEALVRTQIANATADGESVNESEITNRIEMSTSSTLKGVKPILLLYRDADSGRVEVLMKVALDKSKIAVCDDDRDE